jgi:signal transduction histidine kinase
MVTRPGRLADGVVGLPRRTLALLRRRPAVADTVLAAALLIAAFVSLSATFELLRQDPGFAEPSNRFWIVVSLLVTIGPLALRRRYPLLVPAAVIAAFVVARWTLPPHVPGLPTWEGIFTVWACWLALYTAVVHRRRNWRSAAVVGTLTVVLIAEVIREIFVYQGGTYRGLPVNQGLLLAYNVVVIALPILLGVAVRSSRERQQKLVAQASELQREREENARRAVIEERVRIARELHDVVAHHVSVMGVQAGAARRVLARQPDTAEVALSSIESSSRQAVAELQHLLGVLRRADQPDALAPQPDLAQLPDLIAAGSGPLEVTLTMEGQQRPLPATLELSAYRVIQEALTNAMKHSGGSAATVRLVYHPDLLEIEVRDNGLTAQRRPNGTGGHGLIGMRERVRLHDGQLRVGPVPEGGFTVQASFPLPGNAG